MHQRLLTPSPFAVSLAGLLALAGCGDVDAAESTGLERAAIVNGVRSVDADDSTVQLTSSPPGSPVQSCTGTLVAPNIVLTALHCVAQSASGEFSCNADGTVSSTKPGYGSLGELASPEKVEIRTGIYPGKIPDAYGAKLFGTGTNHVCRNDLAVVVLDRDLELPLSAIRLARGVELGELMRIVGYGSTEISGTTGRYARAGRRVIDRGQDAGGSATGTAAPYTIVIGQGPCHGDSGGPIFSEETGALVGVYSLVSGASCTATGVRNVYTRLEPFAELVQSAFDFAMQSPLLEPAPAAGGAGGLGGTSNGAGSSVGGQGGLSNPSAGSDSASAGAVQRPGGSGSRQDASCACRAAGSARTWPLGLSALVGALALLVRRAQSQAARRNPE